MDPLKKNMTCFAEPGKHPGPMTNSIWRMLTRPNMFEDGIFTKGGWTKLKVNKRKFILNGELVLLFILVTKSFKKPYIHYHVNFCITHFCTWICINDLTREEALFFLYIHWVSVHKKARKILFFVTWYLTALGLRIGCSCWSVLSTCSASSSKRVMNSPLRVCSEEEQTGVFTSCSRTRYLLSTWHSLASKLVHCRTHSKEKK